MQAIPRLGLGGLFCALSAVLLWGLGMLMAMLLKPRAPRSVTGSKASSALGRRECSWRRLDEYHKADYSPPMK
jgi:hypothetical protein